MNDEKMKSYLKGRLGNYEHPVDDTLWSSLNKYIPRERNRTRRTLIAACAAAAAIITGILLLIPPDTGGIGEETQHTVDIRPTGKTAQPGDEPRQTDTPAAAKPVVQRQTAPPQTARAADTDATGQTTRPQPDGDIPTNAETHTGKNEETGEPAGDNTVRQARRPPGERYPPPLPERRNKRDRNLSMLLAVGGSGSSGNEYYAPLEPSGDYLFTSEGEPIILHDPVYDFPVSVSLAVRKGLTGKLAVETGLTYTYLHTSDTGGSTDVKLHYLGIPVRGIYTFYDNRRISLYAGAGGMVERRIAGKLKHESGNRNLTYSGLQWSVNASVGLNLKLGNHAGLFAEPGMSYFFDDGSYIPTIRKDKPLNFNLQVGLRFDINR